MKGNMGRATLCCVQNKLPVSSEGQLGMRNGASHNHSVGGREGCLRRRSQSASEVNPVAAFFTLSLWSSGSVISSHYCPI